MVNPTVTCTICGKKFQKRNLEKHITRVHDGINPLKCTDCEVIFSRKCYLDIHISHCHKDKINMEKVHEEENELDAMVHDEENKGHVSMVHEEEKKTKVKKTPLKEKVKKLEEEILQNRFKEKQTEKQNINLKKENKDRSKIYDEKIEELEKKISGLEKDQESSRRIDNLL